ncbi:trypsin-like peptidase domain-containing protein [Nitrogeniibacter mangrovi]|uniref:Trypsin-like peptidase domain-containing protein n=1 Tax=Nitrogeniibacter mangrovi TaxID=2016596 RepID=A0A6C1B4X9_9RHOO|nr:serine protease [Nitrogeniibacter mangrovi]QID18742.1 trypsin-like peptidase domain-containing protein [Nitrogeniibacter mangrovi]
MGRRLLIALACVAWMHCAWADLPAAIRQIKPAVVAVGTYQPTRSPAFRFLGTGFAVADGLTIATNAHVLPDVLDTDKLESLAIVVPLGDRINVRRVEKLRTDPDHDVAVLRIAAGAPLPTLTLAEGPTEEGESVAFTGFPIGSALGLRPVTHRGIISAITPISIPRGNARELNARQIHRLANSAFSVYQLDATAYPGNSGSPMFDPETGQVIGIVNMVFVKETKEDVLSKPSGISYAIPVRYLRSLVDKR